MLPTGSGKTRLAAAVMARCARRSLCVVPTRALLEQWVRVVSELYKGRVGCLGDGERRLEPVTVATIESAYRHMARLGNRFDLLVVDEAHHFGCGQRDEVLEMSTAPFRLGLTATPARDGRVATTLQELVGPTVFRDDPLGPGGELSRDVGIVVHVYENGEAYEVEFLTLDGKTVTVTSLEASRIRPLEPHELAHARSLGEA